MTEPGEVRDGMRVEWDVPIEVDDGLVLRADVFRPPDGSPCPVILSYGPYAKGLAFQDGYPSAWERMVTQHPDVETGSTNAYQNWEVVDPEKWVPHGYACVRVDSRGCGRSPGRIDHYSPREQRDLYECIEWAAARPWSDGKVGLSGISYLASNQWHVAQHAPPHLAAMVAWEGAADFYRDMTHHGGIRSTFWDNWFDLQVIPVQHGYGERGARSRVTGELVAGPETLSDEELAVNRVDFGAEIQAHELDGPHYRDRSPDWSKVTVPFLSASNWGGQGLHPRGNVEAFTQAASTEKWLECHGLEHWTHYYTDYGVDLQRRFLDHFLKGVDNGWPDQPRVLLQVRHVDRFVERGEDDWPIPRTRWTRTYLQPDGTLADGAPDAATALPFEAMGEGLTFLATPVEAETEVTGPVAATLFVSSSTVDADLFCVLRAFAPDGSEVTFQGAIDPHTPIAQGWLRASHRALDPQRSTDYRPFHPHDRAEPLELGAVVRLEVELWPTSIVLPAGYRLGLSVLGRDYEYAASTGARLSNFANELRGSGPFLHDDPRDRPAAMFAGTTTLHVGGAHPSSLLLPVIPPL